MARSLYWKITIPFAALVLIGMGILGIYLVQMSSDTQLAQLRQQLVSEAHVISEVALPDFAPPVNGSQLNALARRTGGQASIRVTLIAPDGTVLGDSLEDPATMANQSATPEVAAALASGVGQSTRRDPNGEDVMYVAVPVVSQGKTVGVARIAVSEASVESAIGNARLTIFVALGVGAVAVIVSAALIARMITRPVRRMTRAARRIASGEMHQAIPVDSQDEVGQLGHAFNEMSRSVRDSMAAISEERGKLATVFASVTDGLAMVDAEGQLALANPAVERLFGFKESAMLGQPLIRAVRDDEIDGALKECLRTRREQTVQVGAASGRFLRVIAVPLERPYGALLVIQDLTEMRSLQTTRREFVANVSHELRTPLTGIKAIVETLQDGAIDDRQVAADFLAKIDAEVDRMSQMVSELIELSRIESGGIELKLEPVDLNEVARHVIARFTPLAERAGVSLSADLADGLPAVSADRERIEQVLINIVHNAIKFTPSGGKATIVTRPAPDAVSVAVTDTGIGISREDLPHIFERFFKADRSRSSGGTGLGLAIAKHTVQAHHGTISVASEEGRGSTFTFTLPLIGF